MPSMNTATTSYRFCVVQGLREHSHELVDVLLRGHDAVDVGAVQDAQLARQILGEDVGVGDGVLAFVHQRHQVVEFPPRLRCRPLHHLGIQGAAESAPHRFAQHCRLAVPGAVGTRHLLCHGRRLGRQAEEIDSIDVVTKTLKKLKKKP